jgi:hypothetical protein
MIKKCEPIDVPERCERDECHVRFTKPKFALGRLGSRGFPHLGKGKTFLLNSTLKTVSQQTVMNRVIGRSVWSGGAYIAHVRLCDSKPATGAAEPFSETEAWRIMGVGSGRSRFHPTFASRARHG